MVYKKYYNNIIISYIMLFFKRGKKIFWKPFLNRLTGEIFFDIIYEVIFYFTEDLP